jgi:GNAT superfamily N-acetyltransferase
MLQGDEVAASVKLTVTRHPSAYATLGEVATHPSFRRRGIAQELCRRAQDDFRSLGGQMIALGTGNPVAARRYFALGYRRLPGTDVWWNNVGDCRSPEEWAVDYFRAAEAAALAAGSGDLTKALSIAEGTPMARVRMLPLIHHPHQSLLSLDANVGLYSTRVSIVTSVNGLYPRYNSLPVESCGQWWTAQTCKMETDGREQIGTLVGLATAWFDPASQHGVLWVALDGQSLCTRARYGGQLPMGDSHELARACPRATLPNLLCFGLWDLRWLAHQGYRFSLYALTRWRGTAHGPGKYASKTAYFCS